MGGGGRTPPQGQQQSHQALRGCIQGPQEAQEAQEVPGAKSGLGQMSLSDQIRLIGHFKVLKNGLNMDSLFTGQSWYS
jgi:hypothetical protein